MHRAGAALDWVCQGVAACAEQAGWRATPGWHCSFVAGAPRLALLFTLTPISTQATLASVSVAVDDEACPPPLRPKPPRVAQWSCGEHWNVERKKSSPPIAEKWQQVSVYVASMVSYWAGLPEPPAPRCTNLGSYYTARGFRAAAVHESELEASQLAAVGPSPPVVGSPESNQPEGRHLHICLAAVET